MVEKVEKQMVKGNIAIAEGAMQAGCRFYFGYPITPQNDIPEHLAAELPKVGGTFIQAESEIASINMLMGASAAGARAMTSSSGPGISLMQEGLSYMAGSQLPAVVVCIQRIGPGLGGIAPTQGDYKQATRGGGHGDYRTIVLAPNSVQEMFDLTIKAFELADKYRNPAVLLADAILGQMKEPAVIRRGEAAAKFEKPWSLSGSRGRRPNLIKSLYLGDGEMEEHNWMLFHKYRRLAEEDTMFEEMYADDAEILLVAFGSCSRMVMSAVWLARERGIRAALLRPISVYPFPTRRISEITRTVKNVLTVEMNTGQMVEDVRLAAQGDARVSLLPRPGGGLPAPEEILEKIKECVGQGGPGA